MKRKKARARESEMERVRKRGKISFELKGFCNLLTNSIMA